MIFSIAQNMSKNYIPLRREKLAEGFGGKSSGKYIARTALYQPIEMEALAKQVALNTDRKPSVVREILTNLVESIEDYMSKGHSIRLGNLGLLRLQAQSEPDEDPSKVKASLTPSMWFSPELRKMVSSLPTKYIDHFKGDPEEEGGDDTPPTEFAILVQVSVGQENMGSVEGSGEYAKDEEITIKAIPAEGHSFVAWADDAEAPAQRTITVTESKTYTASFKKDNPEFSGGLGE